jgi:hypothetical protein
MENEAAPSVYISRHLNKIFAVNPSPHVYMAYWLHHSSKQLFSSAACFKVEISQNKTSHSTAWKYTYCTNRSRWRLSAKGDLTCDLQFSQYVSEFAKLRARNKLLAQSVCVIQFCSFILFSWHSQCQNIISPSVLINISCLRAWCLYHASTIGWCQ